MISFKVSNDESLVRKYTLMCLDLLKMSCASRLECFLRSTQIYLFLFNTKIMNCINKNKTSPNCLNVLKHGKKSIKLSPHWKRCESYVLDLENIIYFPEMGGGRPPPPFENSRKIFVVNYSLTLWHELSITPCPRIYPNLIVISVNKTP